MHRAAVSGLLPHGGAVRKKEQYHHRCKCPKQFFWACDGDCENCEHHLGFGTLSLDASNTEDENSLLDTELTPSINMEDIYADRALLEQLFQRLRELDPDADRIIELWKENDKISDRSIAEALGRKPRTFADQNLSDTTVRNLEIGRAHV